MGFMKIIANERFENNPHLQDYLATMIALGAQQIKTAENTILYFSSLPVERGMDRSEWISTPKFFAELQELYGEKQTAKTTTIEIDRELHQQLKILAAKQGKKMKEIIEEPVRRLLAENSFSLIIDVAALGSMKVKMTVPTAPEHWGKEVTPEKAKMLVENYQKTWIEIFEREDIGFNIYSSEHGDDTVVHVDADQLEHEIKDQLDWIEGIIFENIPVGFNESVISDKGIQLFVDFITDTIRKKQRKSSAN